MFKRNKNIAESLQIGKNRNIDVLKELKNFNLPKLRFESTFGRNEKIYQWHMGITEHKISVFISWYVIGELYFHFDGDTVPVVFKLVKTPPNLSLCNFFDVIEILTNIKEKNIGDDWREENHLIVE